MSAVDDLSVLTRASTLQQASSRKRLTQINRRRSIVQLSGDAVPDPFPLDVEGILCDREAARDLLLFVRQLGDNTHFHIYQACVDLQRLMCAVTQATKPVDREMEAAGGVTAGGAVPPQTDNGSGDEQQTQKRTCETCREQTDLDRAGARALFIATRERLYSAIKNPSAHAPDEIISLVEGLGRCEQKINGEDDENENVEQQSEESNTNINERPPSLTGEEAINETDVLSCRADTRRVKNWCVSVLRAHDLPKLFTHYHFPETPAAFSRSASGIDGSDEELKWEQAGDLVLRSESHSRVLLKCCEYLLNGLHSNLVFFFLDSLWDEEQQQDEEEWQLAFHRLLDLYVRSGSPREVPLPPYLCRKLIRPAASSQSRSALEHLLFKAQTYVLSTLQVFSLQSFLEQASLPFRVPSVSSILQHDDHKRDFLDFATNIHAEENVLFYLDASSLSTSDDETNDLTRLYHAYLIEGAPSPVCCTAKLRKEVDDYIKDSSCPFPWTAIASLRAITLSILTVGVFPHFRANFPYAAEYESMAAPYFLHRVSSLDEVVEDIESPSSAPPTSESSLSRQPSSVDDSALQTPPTGGLKGPAHSQSRIHVSKSSPSVEAQVNSPSMSTLFRRRHSLPSTLEHLHEKSSSHDHILKMLVESSSSSSSHSRDRMKDLNRVRPLLGGGAKDDIDVEKLRQEVNTLKVNYPDLMHLRRRSIAEDAVNDYENDDDEEVELNEETDSVAVDSPQKGDEETDENDDKGTEEEKEEKETETKKKKEAKSTKRSSAVRFCPSVDEEKQEMNKEKKKKKEKSKAKPALKKQVSFRKYADVSEFSRDDVTPTTEVPIKSGGECCVIFFVFACVCECDGTDGWRAFMCGVR